MSIRLDVSTESGLAINAKTTITAKNGGKVTCCSEFPISDIALDSWCGTNQIINTATISIIAVRTRGRIISRFFIDYSIGVTILYYIYRLDKHHFPVST